MVVSKKNVSWLSSWIHRRGWFLARVVVVGAVSLFILYVANQNFFLTPEIRATYRPSRPTGKVLSPTSNHAFQAFRTDKTKLTWSQALDTATFSLRIPRIIHDVTLRWDFARTKSPLIVLGAEVKKGQTDSPVIVRHEGLDKLSWNTLVDQGMTVWQRPERPPTVNLGKKVEQPRATPTPVKQYSSLTELFQQRTGIERLAFMGVNPLAYYEIPGYQSSSPITIERTFRGALRMYFYSGGETVSFRWIKRDLNLRWGGDPMVINISKVPGRRNTADFLSRTITVKDDGVVAGTHQLGPDQIVEVALPDVLPGVYVMDIQTSNDVVWSDLQSSQSYLFFDTPVTLAEGPAYADRRSRQAINLYSEGDTLSVRTTHAAGTQTLRLGRQSRKLILSKTEKFTGVGSTVPLQLERGDVTIANNGFVTVAPAKLLPAVRPKYIPITANLSLEDIDYLVAPYLPNPAAAQKITRTYLLDHLFLSKRTLHFTLFSYQASSGFNGVELNSVQAVMRRNPLQWREIFQKVKKNARQLVQSNDKK